MKAIILAGGRGKRIDTTGNKCMLIFRDKPIIQYSIENAARAEIERIIIVIGYRGKQIRNYFKAQYKFIPITYVKQREQKGVVHALECATKEIENDDFLLMLGDEMIMDPWHLQMRQYFDRHKLFGVCGIVPVDNIKSITKTYSIACHHKQIFRMVEKPKKPFNNMMGTGNCMFKNEILEYIKDTPINLRRGRKEKELPDLIQCAIDDGNKIDWYGIGTNYENVNTENSLHELQKWGHV